MALVVYGGLHKAPFEIGQSGAFHVYYSDIAPSIDEVLACCKLILELLKKKGYRRERPSRLELMQKMNQIFVENIDIRKELKRIRLMSEENNGNTSRR